MNLNSIQAVKRVSGLVVKGKEILLPTDIAGLTAWWQWKTGITIGTGVSQWDDQSGNGHHLVQASGTLQPAYNSTTGVLTPDGINDYLSCADAINTATGELTIVLDLTPTPNSNPLFSKTTNNAGGDNDVLSFIPGIGRNIAKSIAIGAGGGVSSLTTVPAGKYVVSWSQLNINVPTKIYINGTEVAYSTRNIAGNGWQGSNASQGFGLFRRMSTTSITYAVTPVLEICWHNAEMSQVTRSKLITYFRNKHGI